MSDHLTHQHGNHPGADEQRAQAWRVRARWVFIAFAVIAAGYLISEHRAHLGGVLPFLIILACPLLHMFMHGGHGGHGDHSGHGGGSEGPEDQRSGGRGGR
jgi:hypothetical protein